VGGASCLQGHLSQLQPVQQRQQIRAEKGAEKSSYGIPSFSIIPLRLVIASIFTGGIAFQAAALLGLVANMSAGF
jgi:hypothetical protein